MEGNLGAVATGALVLRDDSFGLFKTMQTGDERTVAAPFQRTALETLRGRTTGRLQVLRTGLWIKHWENNDAI
jgi:hypothetical protein